MSHIFTRIRHSYGDMKLESKFTLVLLLTATVPVIMMACFFYGKLYDMVVSYTIRQEQDTSAQTAPYIEDLVQQIIDAHDGITDQEFFQILFHQPVNSPFQMFLDTNDAQYFHEYVENLIDSDMISGLQIYMDFPPQSVRLFSDDLTKDYFSPMSKARGTYWYGIFQGTQQSSLFCPAFYLGEREKKKYGDLAYITSTTFYYQGKARQAYIALYSSSDYLSDMLKDNLTIDGSVSYIINDRNAVVASSDVSLSGIYLLDYDTIEESFMSSNNFIERNILDTTVYAGFYNIKQPEWFMVTVLPSGPLIHQSNAIMVQYILMYLGFLVFALVLAHFMSHSITNRISSVIHQMSKVRKGTLSPMDSPEYHDEIGDLIDTYNYMTRKMDQLMTDQAKAAEELRIAEFRSLQAQINPHFLYNTLSMMNWMAIRSNQMEISKVTLALSTFYRTALSKGEDVVTVENCIQNMEAYLEIQLTMHDHNFSVDWDIDPTIKNEKMPKLLLQPVVENAIEHGLDEKEDGDKKIFLSFKGKGDDVEITVRDNGLGMEQEKAETLVTYQAKGYGLKNVNDRIRLLYGENYGIHIFSSPDEGTTVIMKFPKEGRENEE